MVIKFELGVSSKSSRQLVFGPKKWNAETLKTIVCQTAPLTKLPPGGFLFIHEIWCFQTKDFFLGIESIIFKVHHIASTHDEEGIFCSIYEIPIA